MTPVFCTQQFDRETHLHSDSVQCQAQQVRQALSADVVLPDATDPVVQILQTRFLRAWQKMLDDSLDYFQVQGERDREGRRG
jgi:hypothetical protein